MMINKDSLVAVFLVLKDSLVECEKLKEMKATKSRAKRIKRRGKKTGTNKETTSSKYSRRCVCKISRLAFKASRRGYGGSIMPKIDLQWYQHIR